MDFLKNMNPTLRKTLLVVLVIVVAYLIYLWVKPKVQDWILEQKMKSERKKDIIASDLTYSNSEYTDMAGQIFKAMDGIGTDTDVILNIAKKMKTKSDWLKLVDTFGIKEVSSGIIFVSDYKGTLPELLPTELSSSEMEELNYILKSIDVQI